MNARMFAASMFFLGASILLGAVQDIWSINQRWQQIAAMEKRIDQLAALKRPSE